MSPIVFANFLINKNTLQGYKKKRASLEKCELATLRNIVRIRKILS